MIVLVERVELMINVGYEQIQPTILVEIGRVDAHARSRPACIAICDTRFRTDLLKFSTVVLKEKILHRIIGDKEIHPAIVVDVGSNCSPSFSEVVPDS